MYCNMFHRLIELYSMHRPIPPSENFFLPENNSLRFLLDYMYIHNLEQLVYKKNKWEFGNIYMLFMVKVLLTLYFKHTVYTLF